MATTDLTRAPFEDKFFRNFFDRTGWPFTMMDRPQDMPMMENLALDMYEKDNALVIKAAMPGLEQKDVKITITDDMLRIEGERKEEKEVKKDQYYLKEYRSGMMSRTVRLPSNVMTDKATATFDKGMLYVTLPRMEKAKPHHVEVKVQ